MTSGKDTKHEGIFPEGKFCQTSVLDNSWKGMKDLTDRKQKEAAKVGLTSTQKRQRSYGIGGCFLLPGQCNGGRQQL